MIKLYFTISTLLSCLFVTAQVTSVASGNWNAGSTWSTGTIPTSSSQVIINNGHTVTVNTAAVAGMLTINAGGTLAASSGTLAVSDSVMNAGNLNVSGTAITINGAATTGLTNMGTFNLSAGSLTIGPAGGSNRQLRNVNNGTINMTSGVLDINGNFYHWAPCNLTQSGGVIRVDGNAGGNLANSVAAGTAIVHFTFATYTDGGVLNLNGGMLQIVDPHPAGSPALFHASYGQGQRELSPQHTFVFGFYGSSTDPGVNDVGFQLDLANSENLALGSMIVDGPPANNRYVTMKDDAIVLMGSLFLNHGSEFRPGHDIYIAGNLNVNMGSTLTAPGLWFTKKNIITGATATVTSPQSVFIDGTIRNSATAPTASVNTLMNNNNSGQGLTISGDNIHVANQLILQYNTLLNMFGHTLTLGTSPASPGSMFANGSFSPNLGKVINAKIKRFIGANTGVYDFPLGTSLTTTARKLVSLDFVQAPTTGGSITVEWVGTNGGSNGLPLQQGSITIDTTLLGYWKLTPGDGLAGGMYHGTFQPMLITEVPNYTKTVLLKRDNNTSPWTLHGTHNTTSSYNNNHMTLYRTNMTQFGEFGIGYSTAADNSATTVSSGNWHNAAIWSTGFVPNSNTNVIIGGGHEVNVNVSGNYQAKSVTINSGGVLRVQTTSLYVTDSVVNHAVLFVEGGELNITGAPAAGLTNNGVIEMMGGYLRVGGNGGYRDRSFINRHFFVMSNGTVEINGNFRNTATAHFTQAGGDIIVSTAAASNPLPAGRKTVEFLNPSTKINFSGGTFTITDPHPANEHTLYFQDPGGTIITSPSHTFRFGNALGSSPSGGHMNGYYITMGGTHGGLHFGNLVIDGPDGYNRHVSWDIPVTIQGNLTVNDGELRPLTGTTFKGNFTVNVSGIATFAETVIFSGTGVQNIIKPGVVRSGMTPHGHFTSLIISNSGGGVNAFADIGVHQLISFTNGGIINMNGATLSLGSPAGTSGSVGNVQGWVIGKFKNYVTPTLSGYTFPLGSSTGRKYASIDFYTAAPTTFGSVTAEWVPTYGGTNGLPLTEGSLVIDSTSRSGYWRITSGDGLTGGIYKASLFGQGIEGVTDVSKVVMLKRSDASSPWTLSGTHVTTTGNPSTGMMLTRENMNGFSDFGIGISSGNTPLPVTLVSFTGKVSASIAIDLEWSVAQQQGIDQYIVERSADGISFKEIGTVKANTLDEFTYQFTDALPLNGKNYYRLRIVEANGSRYSKMILLSVATKGSVEIYPVPVKDMITLSVSDQELLNTEAFITDMSGKVMQRFRITQHIQEMNISALRPGLYLLKTLDGSVIRIIKQ